MLDATKTIMHVDMGAFYAWSNGTITQSSAVSPSSSAGLQSPRGECIQAVVTAESTGRPTRRQSL
jgi:hypothetical protein